MQLEGENSATLAAIGPCLVPDVIEGALLQLPAI